MKERVIITDVNLRALEPEDVDKLYLWENNKEVWPYGTTRAPLSRHQLWAYATNYDANPFAAGQLRLMIDITVESHDCASASSSNTVSCGTIDLYDIDPVNSRTMVGIMIAPQWRKKGIGSKALKLVDDYCRDTLGLTLIASEVASDNHPSIRLFKDKAQYQHVGIRPDWLRRGNSFISALLFQKSLR